jgi:hypothetical protein
MNFQDMFYVFLRNMGGYITPKVLLKCEFLARYKVLYFTKRFLDSEGIDTIEMVSQAY